MKKNILSLAVLLALMTTTISPFHAALAGVLNDAAYVMCQEGMKNKSEAFCQCFSHEALDQYVDQIYISKTTKRLDAARQAYMTSKQRLITGLHKDEAWFGEYCAMADRYYSELNVLHAASVAPNASQADKTRANEYLFNMRNVQNQILKDINPDHSFEYGLRFDAGVCNERREIGKKEQELADIKAQVSDGTLTLSFVFLKRMAYEKCQNIR